MACRVSYCILLGTYKAPLIVSGVVDKSASSDLEQDALDLVDLVGDQVRRLGAHSRTKKAITIFGHVGRQNFASQFSPSGDLKLESRKPRVQRNMAHLLFETFLSFLESAVSSLLMWTGAFLRWSWKTTNAHTVILSLLLASVLINGFYSLRVVHEWWDDRSIGNFMARIGVGPDNVMSRAIYMRDIDEAIANITVGRGSGNVSDCFATFHQQTLREPGTALSLGSAGFRDSMTKSAARRIQQTRERLATYRHNLLVALRVVNSIEREVIQNEWERWLRQELRRCRQVGILLGQNDDLDDAEMEGERTNSNAFANLSGDVKQWYGMYCSSCQAERSHIEDDHAFGEL